MYNDEFELTFDLADAGPKKEQRRPTLPEPEEAAVAAPPVQETRETPVSAAPENTPAPEREPEPAAEPQSTAPAAKGRTVLISGGDRGIGAAAARAFYAAGCRVAVFYHRKRKIRYVRYIRRPFWQRRDRDGPADAP